MPVDLSSIPARRKVRVHPPTVLGWGIAFVVWMSVWIAGTLWLWPPGASTHSWRFWAILCEVPLLLFGAVYCIPWLAYQFEQNSVVCHNVAVDFIIGETVHYAQEPLQVFASAYCTAMGIDDVARKIVSGRKLLMARDGEGPRGQAVRCTRLPIMQVQDEVRSTGESETTQPTLADRYISAMEGILTAIKPSLSALPQHVPLHLRVCQSAIQNVPGLAQSAEQLVRRFGVVCDSAATVLADKGAMLLDDRLDQPPGDGLDCYTLVVAVQLHETPPDNSGEAAACLLLGGPSLRLSGGVAPLAALHRPVSGEAKDSKAILAEAIQWGGTDRKTVERVWLSGMERDMRPVLDGVSSAMGATSAGESLSLELGDVDSALGHCGVASPWLAIALAIERHQVDRRCQLWASGSTNSLQIGAIGPINNKHVTA
jgi:hypothetical protein